MPYLSDASPFLKEEEGSVFSPNFLPLQDSISDHLNLDEYNGGWGVIRRRDGTVIKQ